MLFEIKCRFSGRVLFSKDCDSLNVCVEAAVEAGANLARAYLAGANLARAYLAGANLADANLARITGCIGDSHELLAHIAVRFDASLLPVAAMIAGRMVGCWREYTTAIRQWFGEETMLRLRQAWSQNETWGVIARMDRYGWPKAGGRA